MRRPPIPIRAALRPAGTSGLWRVSLHAYCRSLGPSSAPNSRSRWPGARVAGPDEGAGGCTHS